MAIERAKIAMPPCVAIDIPVLPETALGHALQLADLLHTANMLASLRHGAQAPRIGWRLTDAQGQPLSITDGPLLPCSRAGAFEGPATALFIAPLHCPDIPAVRLAVDQNPALARRLGVAVDQGMRICTQGSGAWLAAHSGRLDGRRVALPWYYIGGFGHDFPGISIATAQDFHEDGPWLSAALSTGMVDMAATLAQQAMGPELAQALRAVLCPDPERGQAALEARQARHIPSTRDSTLARAIAWMEQHLDRPYQLDAVAAAASVSQRTLLRHFREELGHSPLDHLHGLRCARARVLLEITLESIPTIAQACGYADPAAFRRVFARHTGLSPTAYRQRHTLRAPRRRWRVETAPRVEAVLEALRSAAKK